MFKDDDCKEEDELICQEWPHDCNIYILFRKEERLTGTYYSKTVCKELLSDWLGCMALSMVGISMI